MKTTEQGKGLFTMPDAGGEMAPAIDPMLEAGPDRADVGTNGAETPNSGETPE